MTAQASGGGFPSAAVPAADVTPAALLDALVDATALVDAEDVVVAANAAARDVGLVPGGRVEPRALRDLLRGARREGAGDEELELWLGAGRRRRLPVEAAARALVPGAAPPGAVLVVLRDRREARRLDDVRRDFVANVSHELKTPVGALSVLAEAVAEAADDPAAVVRFATRMREEATRLGRLVQDLIELSRLQGAEAQPAPAPVPVSEVVAEAVDRNRPSADSLGKQIVVGPGAAAGEAPVVSGDERQLVTALSNLIDNALAYSPPATAVAVAVRQVRRDGRDWVELSVTDQGIGIADADRDRIFERFYRVDPARSRATGGTGLGLAIVKHVVGNHGGEIELWSVPGHGSTFTLRLPRDGAADPTAGVPAAAGADSGAEGVAGGAARGREVGT